MKDLHSPPVRAIKELQVFEGCHRHALYCNRDCVVLSNLHLENYSNTSNRRSANKGGGKQIARKLTRLNSRR